jgi:dTDP-glucose pyrophosphorylase
MLNIVIPMAGRGSRFADVGYKMPKPLIDVLGKPMIQWVIENLKPSCDHQFIFICQQEHMERYQLDVLLEKSAPGSKIVAIPKVTEGAACTVLLSEDLIDNDDPLMIANSDQWINFDINQYLDYQFNSNLDGLILTMTANDPKWSFVRFDDKNKVIEVVEKEVISDEATVGVYNYKHGKDFISAAKSMITKNLRVNGEFYVAPAYNQMIEKGMELGVFNVGNVADGIYGLGTPEDLNIFLKSGVV